MPAIDNCQPQVIHAFEKDGWQVDKAPFKIATPHRQIYIDVKLSRQLNGIRQELMLIEVKCFPNRENTTPEIYGAIGQYLLYQYIVHLAHYEIPLYLAVPHDVYASDFDATIQGTFKQSKINVVLVDLAAEELKQWIEW